MERADRHPKVYWTPAEWLRLAKACAPLIHKGWDPLAAYRYAQDLVLPMERRRPLSGREQLQHGKPMLEEELQNIALGAPPVTQGSMAQPRPAAPAPAPEPEAPKGNGALPAWMEKQIEAEAERQAADLRKKYEEELARRVREKLAAPIAAEPPAPVAPLAESPKAPPPAPAAATGSQQTEPRRKHNPEPPASGQHKPKVVLIGLWPNLRAEINREFQETLDLRWFDNNQNDFAVIERHVRSADFVIMPDAIHGNIANMARRAARKFEQVHGSTSAMVDRLTKFVVYNK